MGEALTRAAVVTGATAGTWSYTWGTGELDTPGVWDVEAQATYAGGRVQTFGPARFVVRPQIG